MNNKNNKNEKLIDSIGKIDDSFIEQSLNYKKKTVSWKKYVSVAACALIVVGFAGLGLKFLNKKDLAPGGVKEENSKYDGFYDGFKDEAVSGMFTQNSSNNDGDTDGFKGEEISKGLEEDYEDMQRPVPPIEEEPELTVSGGEVDEESKGDILEENPDLFLNAVPDLKKEVEIDDLNKLAYYSGWTLLKKHGYYNSNILFAEDNLRLLSNTVFYNNGYGTDVSEMDFPPLFIDTEWEASNEYTGLIPVFPDDPDNSKILMENVYELTVRAVEYFKIQIYQEDFLAEHLGAGVVEVMLLEVELKNETTDRMLVFRNGDNFFSCFEESAWENQNGDWVYRFTASEYVSKFNVLNMPEYSDYTFSFTFSYDGEKLSDINFAYSESPYSSKIQSVSIQSYDFANNVSVSNSVDKLSEELYNIYLEEIAAGITYPVHPEKPKLPENSEEKDQSEDIGADIGMLDYLPFAVSELFLLEGEGSFETETGFMVISNDSDEKIKKLFPNEYFSDLLQKLDNGDNEEKWAIVWVKGRARISDYKAYPRNDKDISLNFEYVLFENSDIFSVFAFEIDEKYELTSVDFNPVSYSATVRATFTTENEYDYLDGNEEDEYTINLQDNLTYSLYKNDELVYMGEYKVSGVYVVLCTEDDVFYNEISPVSTFAYKLDGLNRIFMLK